MNKRQAYIILGVVVFIIVLVVSLPKLLTKTVSPNYIAIMEMDVRKEAIIVKGNFAESATDYKGFKAEKEGNNLFIELKGSVLPIGKPDGSFSIKIFKKDFGDINGVYLRGGSEKKLIWEES
ncbi:hypothetical protein [Neobacillus sp. YIM B06451]|uniref:hypothetical protein n=1 Tax=Neobacillus sp. YIM B06451 TaxID=3070994 RepID=UPI00292DB636|nr:hypothetical protein [Neobacillus sp. YIM B06451]